MLPRQFLSFQFPTTNSTAKGAVFAGDFTRVICKAETETGPRPRAHCAITTTEPREFSTRDASTFPLALEAIL
jgi:hypothetical protein